MSYLPTYESDKYNAITEAEELENEKDRIMKKFNFYSNNWNICNTNTKKSNDNSSQYSSSISSKEKYLSSNTPSHSSVIVDGNGNNNNDKRKVIDDEVGSEDTEKDLKAIVENALLNGNMKLLENRDDNLIANENEPIYDKSVYTFTPANVQFKENSYRRKVEALFKVHDSYSNCEISNRDMFNNPKLLTNYLSNTRDFRFIDTINQNNLSQPSININKFLSISDYSLYNLLSFCYDQYDLLMNHKLILAKFTISLGNIFEKSLQSFKTQYNDLMTLQSHYFTTRNIRLNRVNCSIFDMIFKVKLIKKPEINKCYTFSCSYYADNEYYIQSWKFDYVKEKQNSFWICSEGQYLSKGIKRYSYFQPIIPFTQGDIIEFHLSIFNNYVYINPFSIKWLKVFEEVAPNFLYQKSVKKQNYGDIRQERYCELENMIHIWKSQVNLLGMSFAEEVKRVFGKCFKFLDTSFDHSSFLFFKFKLKAVHQGKIHKNFLLNFDLEIVNDKTSTENEIQNMGLMNINSHAEKYQIRLGSEVILYATELYK